LEDPDVYGVVSFETCGKKIRLVASNSRIARRRIEEGGGGGGGRKKKTLL
jgi:hypothetical protein